MGSSVRLIIIFLGVAFVITVLYLLVKRKLDERNSLFWFAGAIITLLLSVVPNILDSLARSIGVDYPPALLFLVAILVILFILLYQSIQISVLQEKSRELVQILAITEFVEKEKQLDKNN